MRTFIKEKRVDNELNTIERTLWLKDFDLSEVIVKAYIDRYMDETVLAWPLASDADIVGVLLDFSCIFIDKQIYGSKSGKALLRESALVEIWINDKYFSKSFLVSHLFEDTVTFMRECMSRFDSPLGMLTIAHSKFVLEFVFVEMDTPVQAALLIPRSEVQVGLVLRFIRCSHRSSFIDAISVLFSESEFLDFLGWERGGVRTGANH